MTTYDKLTHLLGTIATAILGAQAAGIAPKDFFPVWAVVVAWIVAEVAKATTSPVMQRPTMGQAIEKSKLPLVLLLGLSLLGAPSCKTGSSPDGGGGVSTVVDDIVHCAESATHQASLNILDDVSSALITGDWKGALADLVSRWGTAAVSCAVQEVAGDANHAFQASGDELSRLKAERGRKYLEAHPASP